jgi:hypothetical protein
MNPLLIVSWLTLDELKAQALKPKPAPIIVYVQRKICPKLERVVGEQYYQKEIK